MMISILYFVLVLSFAVQVIFNIKNSKDEKRRKEIALQKQLESLQAQKEAFEAFRDNYIFEDVSDDAQS